MNQKKRSAKEILKTAFFIVFGNALLAFLVAAFIIPHDIILGGTTGIGIALSRILPVETAVIVLVLNIILLIFGLIVLGKKLFFTTVASSILYPVMLGLFQRIPGIESLTSDSTLAAVFAGVLLGVALGMVMRVGSSTGGTDILCLALNKWLHFPVSVMVYVTDFVVIGVQAIFSTPEKILLGILVVLLESLTLEQVMIFGKSQIQIYVISSKYEEIRQALLKDLNAGVTMSLVETGVSGQPLKAIICVIPTRKLYDANEIIGEIDPDAFTTVTKIKEVRGRGFTTERRVLPLSDLTDSDSSDKDSK